MESSSNANLSLSSSSGGVNINSINTNNSDSSGGTVSWLSYPFRSPISLLVDYSGIMRSSTTRGADSEPVTGLTGLTVPVTRPRFQVHSGSASGSGSGSGSTGSACGGSSSKSEVEIRIIGAGEQENSVGLGSVSSAAASSSSSSSSSASQNRSGEGGSGGCGGDSVSGRIPLWELHRNGIQMMSLEELQAETRRMMELDPPLQREDDGFGGLSDTPIFQRYDLQQAAKWLEQILPFSLLLLFVFIRQHLQGFFVTIFISSVMFKSNEIVKKQTALKGDRKVFVLVFLSFAFMLHVIFIYWWYRNDDLIYPLAMLPPKETPPFWHAMFIILVNDALVRQAAMAFKCLLLIYYKNGRGHNFRQQGQILTLVEYTVLLYRALLPTPVWYRFFLNKDYGSLFSSLTTGLYLTFKLTSAVQKVKCFISSLKALSKREVHYGVYATMEQVNAAGDLCAICQEKMQAPILLRCKHMFCEECVTEWFERERTCPLCRAFVKRPDLRTYGDGSTSLYFQFF